MTDDEVKAVAEAIYAARPLVRQSMRVVGETGTTTDSIDVPWSEVLHDAQLDAVCAGVVRDITDAARAAISKLDEMRGDGWRPIASAPKDGTPILLFGGEPGYGGDIKDHPVASVVAWSDGPAWRYAHYDSGYYGEWESPTHWQPLPNPPQPTSRSGQ